VSRVERIEGTAWRDLVSHPLAVLVIGKSDCPSCTAWALELEQFLAHDEEWRDVRFGKVLLDQPGLVDFKRANPWIAELDSLPYTQIYARGERAKAFSGSGAVRLVRRLRGVRQDQRRADPEKRPGERR
jgi:hypothetical protein